jgi:hypothetical protein
MTLRVRLHNSAIVQANRYRPTRYALLTMTTTIGPTVVCAWCDRLMAAGTRAVSHGICHDCARAFLVALREYRAPATESMPAALASISA